MKRRRDWELSPEDRVDARAALRILEGSGFTLTEAARRTLTRDGGQISRTTLAEAVDGYLRRLLQLKRRGQTFHWYEMKFAVLCDVWGERGLDEITRPEVHKWLTAFPGARTTARGYLRALHALYAWARFLEPPLCRTNPCAGLRIEEPINERSPPHLLAGDVAAMLQRAGRHRHALALMVFAGVRPHEIADPHKPPLEWRHVDREAQLVRIPPEIAKTTGSGRVLERLPDALWAWLADGPTAGRICPGRVREATGTAWQAIRQRRREWKRWPVDVLRHTAASYLLALWEDAGRVSMILGHEGKPQMLFARYRAVMTKAEAAAIAAVRPD